MTGTRTALIIGGGIAGSAAAMALQKAGIESVVYEARDAGADDVGAFLTLASNGVDALRVLHADEPVLASGFQTPSITLRSGSGKRLGETRTGSILADGATSHTLKRQDLYRALRDEAAMRGIRVEHGKRLTDIHDDTPDGVRAEFSDGSEAVADVLVGCDGVHSTVRQLIDVRAPAPEYAGLLGTGGFARGVAVNTAPGTYEMIFGKRAFFGYALAPDREVWWFANLPCQNEPSRRDLSAIDGEEWRRRLLDLYADDEGPAVALVTATATIMPIVPIHAVPHLPVWHRGRSVVIGDAAHAPSPTSGQGASLAIEDAVVLAMCLRDHASTEEAFHVFDAARRRRVERIIRLAARINSSKAAGPVGKVLRDAMLPIVLKLTADNRAANQTFGYHIDWDAPASALARSAVVDAVVANRD
jgi:FAD-dependent urate hydroxylase